MATVSTKQQEDGSKWIFLRALRDDVNYESKSPASEFISKKEQEFVIKKLENSAFPKKFKWDDSYNVMFDKKYIELQKIFSSSYKVGAADPVDEAWLKSFYYQQKALLKKYSSSNFKELEIDRDSPGGFMEFISNLIRPLGVSQKDTWDPADVWIVDKGKIRNENPTKTLENIATVGKNEDPKDRKLQMIKLQEINAKLRDYYRNEKIIGVSLKKAGKNAVYVDVNIGINEAAVEKEFKKIEALVAKIELIKCDLSIKSFDSVYGGGAKEKMSKMKSELSKYNFENEVKYYPTNPLTFGTQDTTVTILDEEDNKTYFLTIKATSTNHYSNLKYEPVEKGKGGARLGKAPTDMVASLMDKYKLSFDNNNQKYPKVYDADKINNFILPKLKQAVNTAGAKIITNITTPNEFLENIKMCYQADPVTAQSKLMQLDFLLSILTLNKTDLSKLLTDIVYVAKKEGRAFGPFGKVY